MKLTIGSQKIALPVDAKISIERSTPLLNDDTGSYSFPFPVPTLPNQQALGWPGKLQRAGDIPDQSFILEESGLQVFRGEVEYDDITADEIGVILKSGYTEFNKKMEGKKLGDLDFGSEWWAPWFDDQYLTTPRILSKFREWDTANTTDNGKYVVAPYWISDTNGSLINVNAQVCTGAVSFLKIVYPIDAMGSSHLVSLQFKVHFVVGKIFESAGYTVVENAITSSEFKDLILYSKVINVLLFRIPMRDGLMTNPSFALDTLLYSALMPDIDILEFMNSIKNILCIMYEIDESKKEVRIKFKKDIFQALNLDGLKINELKGWSHSEQKTKKGFTLKYNAQTSDLDTKYDYVIDSTVASTLPAPTNLTGKIYHITSTGRDYIVEENGTALEWHEIGRLKERREGDGENAMEIDATVPIQKQYTTNGISLESPSLPGILRDPKLYITPVSIFAVTLYHGRILFGSVSFPYASFDRFSLDGTKDRVMSLKPSYLYDTVYSEFLNWQTYRARAFTKYIELSLTELIALQWGKRYMINGVIVILNKINYDLPYDGKVKIEGFTA